MYARMNASIRELQRSRTGWASAIMLGSSNWGQQQRHVAPAVRAAYEAVCLTGFIPDPQRSVETRGSAASRTAVLSLSMRRLAKLVAYSMLYEFEDVLKETTAADCIEPWDMPRLEFSRRTYKLARFTTRSTELARALSIKPRAVRLERDYDLFFPTFNHTHELYALATIPNWRQRCRLAACFVSELWVHLLPRYLLELLAQFDHIFLGVVNPVSEVAKIVGRPCTYLPLATNVLRFAPLPEPPVRAIDVCNIGRRSDVTHGALLDLAQKHEFFYFYDTVSASGADQKQRTFQVDVPAEHRLLLASILKRSRYYFANRARVNEPSYTMGREEISGRFYEGAAAGTIMIGEPPKSSEFRSQFNWPDAAFEVPFHSPDIGQWLQKFDADPARLARSRQQNVHHAALRHDWVHRIRTVFEILGLPPTEAMLLREQQLQRIATLALDDSPQAHPGAAAR